MKKKISLIAILAMIVTVLCACGSKETDETAETVDPDDYVTLGNYQDLNVDVTYVTYTEEDVQAAIEQELAAYVQIYDLYDYEPIVSANTVESGSIVNIDYEGKIDGETFDGGSAQGAHLEIGSGSFIDGFEDGLIGKTVGETVDLDLTFPDDYQNTDYAGKDAVFTVSINSIDDRKTPEYTDDLISQIYGSSGITTYDDYVQYIKDYVESSCNDQNDTALDNAVWDAVYATCEVSDPPQSMVDKQYEDLVEYFEAYAEYSNMDMDTFITSQMGMDTETFEAQNQESAKEQAQIELAYMALAKAEGIEVTDDMVNEVAEAEYADYGYESADAIIEAMGQEDFESYVLRKKVMERLKELVTVTENEPVDFFDDTTTE